MTYLLQKAWAGLQKGWPTTLGLMLRLHDNFRNKGLASRVSLHQDEQNCRCQRIPEQRCMNEPCERPCWPVHLRATIPILFWAKRLCAFRFCFQWISWLNIAVSVTSMETKTSNAQEEEEKKGSSSLLLPNSYIQLSSPGCFPRYTIACSLPSPAFPDCIRCFLNRLWFVSYLWTVSYQSWPSQYNKKQTHNDYF